MPQFDFHDLNESNYAPQRPRIQMTPKSKINKFDRSKYQNSEYA